MDILISLIVMIILQCIHISSHQIVYLKYALFLIVSFTSNTLQYIYIFSYMIKLLI